MCTVCGCGTGEEAIHTHTHDHGHAHDHSHAQAGHAGTGYRPVAGGALHFGLGPAGAHVGGMSQDRLVQVEQDILGKNNGYAERNRKLFAGHEVLALNLVSSPGSGKTTLLTRTIERMQDELPIAVIEGDQQTSFDADRIRATGAPAIQINTGKGCHLDAHMVGHALQQLPPLDHGLLLIENVGNLVCPAAFDLGEAHKVAILSVTEGEDKPLKYPDMFHAADLILLNKVDLLPHLDFDADQALAAVRKVNPKAKMLQVSARSGAGMDAWIEWLTASRQRELAGHPTLGQVA
jgi:hydrogenase nickel incorporation protein HypB